jgi:hypothetical protein
VAGRSAPSDERQPAATLNATDAAPAMPLVHLRC